MITVFESSRTGELNLPKEPYQKTSGSKRGPLSVLVLLSLFAPVAVAQTPQPPRSQQSEETVMISLEPMEPSAEDYLNAKPLPMPTAQFLPGQISDASASYELESEEAWGAPARPGTGELNPEVLIPRRLWKKARRKEQRQAGSNSQEVNPGPSAYGKSSGLPYTVSRVDLSEFAISTIFPYSAAGKLLLSFSSDGSIDGHCTAALIEKGVIITAAHCAYSHDLGAFITAALFVPAYYEGAAPFGAFSALEVWVPTSYIDQAACLTGGVICTNDIATLVLRKNDEWPGKVAGTLGYLTGGSGLTKEDRGSITQLGYPGSHDKGERMIVTHGQTQREPDVLDNNVWGTSQTQGSSGGPGIVNFGDKPSIKSNGKGAKSTKKNRIVQVTSWGPIDDKNLKFAAASRFEKSILKPLVDGACDHSSKPC